MLNGDWSPIGNVWFAPMVAVPLQWTLFWFFPVMVKVMLLAHVVLEMSTGSTITFLTGNNEP